MTYIVAFLYFFFAVVAYAIHRHETAALERATKAAQPHKRKQE